MFQWLRAAFGAVRETAINVSQSLVPRWLSNQTWAIANKFLPLAQSAYGLNALVYACIKFLAQSVPEPPLLVYRRLPDNEHEQVEYDHPLQALIRKPNELMTEYELWELTEIHMDIAGRAHWWKERDNAGNVIALWPLRPDRVGPIYSTSAEPGQRVLFGWSYSIPGSGERIQITRQDIVSFNFPDPAGETGGMVEGIGPTMVLAREIAADNEATSFVGSLLANYAQPAMVIKTKTSITDKDEAARLKRGFVREFSGNGRGEPALLDADTEIEKLSFDLNQLEFPALRANAETRVAAAYGVPPILVGLKAGLDRATYSNAETARRQFTETTLRNRWKRYSDQVSGDLANEFGDDLFVLFDESKVAALAAVHAEQIKPISDAFREGAVTLNEYRQRVLNLPAVQGGDVFVRAANIVVSDQIIVEPGVKALLGSRKALPAPTAEADVPEVIKRARTTRDAHTAAMLAKLGPALADLGKIIVARFDAAAKTVPTIDVIHSESDDEPIKAIIVDGHRATMSAASADAGLAVAKIGLTYDIPLTDADINAMVAGMSDRITGVTATTKSLISDILREGLLGNKTPNEVSAALQESFGFSAARAEMIARTETAFAYGRATVRVYESSGVHAVHIYDGVGDPPCAAVANTTQTLDWYSRNMTSHPNCTRAAAPERELAPRLDHSTPQQASPSDSMSPVVIQEPNLLAGEKLPAKA